MPVEPNPEPASPPDDEPLTPMQEAIRLRALATLENDARQPKPTMRRKIITGVLAVVTVALLLVVIDFAVRIIQRVLELYEQDETAVLAPATPDPNKPFFITVDPPADVPEPAASPSDSTGMTAE